MLISFLLRPSSFLENKKVITLKRKNHEEGNLEIHHSDSCGHLDRHRHQPGSHQLLVGATPDPSIREGNQEKEDEHPLFQFILNFYLNYLELSKTIHIFATKDVCS